jgi:hypothetical protein
VSVDSVKGLVDMASAITGLSVDKARDVTRSLLSAALEALDDPSQAATHVVDVLRAGSAKTSAAAAESVEDLTDKVRDEVDRMAARFGFVREEELAALRARVLKLENLVAASSVSETTSGVPAPAAKSSVGVTAAKPSSTKASTKSAPRPAAKRSSANSSAKSAPRGASKATGTTGKKGS